MSKLKINPGLIALILLACLFVGWETMLIVAVLILLFCEIDEKVKNIFVKVVTFSIAIALFSLFWDLIVSAVNLGVRSIRDLVSVFNSYLDYSNAIDISKLEKYFLTPVQNILSLADSVISYIITFVEFSFAVSILLNKQGKPNFIIKKIEGYVNSAITFVNSFNLSNYNNQVVQNNSQTVYNQQSVQPQNQNNFNQPNM